MMNDISLLYLANLAWRKIWAILIAAVIFATCAFCFCKFFATPAYTATASIIVTNGSIINQNTNNSQTVNGTDLTASQNLAYTIADILKTSNIYKELSDSVDNKYTYDELIRKATVIKRSQDSLFIDIKFSASTEKEAMALANTFAGLSPDYITKFVPYAVTSIAATADKATQSYPRTPITTAVAGMAGAVLAFITVLIIDSFDQAIKGDEDFTSNYKIPLLGTVPDFENISANYTYKNTYKGDYTNAAKK